ncbi:MAG: anti-sigma factor family protein [Planctomycetota bacterium]
MNAAGGESEQQEFLLSQDLDGDLDEAARRKLERQIEADPNLAARLEELRQADQLVKAWAGPVPELDWERFAEEAARRRAVYDTWQRRSRILRLHAPLSAAAMIALAVTVYFAAGRWRPAQVPADAFVSVSVQRADAWRHAPGLGEALAEVSFGRTGMVPEALAAPRAAVAVAAAGVAQPAGEVLVENQAPYF